MANIAKLNKSSLLQLFKAVVTETDEIHEINRTLEVHGLTKRLLQIQPMAHGSEFYVPNAFKDGVLLTKNGHPDIRGWADQELVKNKLGWKPSG